MLSKNERYVLRHSLDLESYGFIKVSQSEYRNDDFFCVFLGEWFVVFSSKQFTTAIAYDKVEQFLHSRGFVKNMSSQEDPGSGLEEE